MQALLLSRALPRRRPTSLTAVTRLQAAATIDAFAKHIYSHLFDWLIDRINVSLRDTHPQPQSAAQSEGTRLGVLDIFGFEIFKVTRAMPPCIRRDAH